MVRQIAWLLPAGLLRSTSVWLWLGRRLSACRHLVSPSFNSWLVTLGDLVNLPGVDGWFLVFPPRLLACVRWALLVLSVRGRSLLRWSAWIGRSTLVWWSTLVGMPWSGNDDSYGCCPGCRSLWLQFTGHQSQASLPINLPFVIYETLHDPLQNILP